MPEERKMKRMALLMMLLALGWMPTLAQTQETPGRSRPPGDNVVGKVTSITKDSLVLAPLTGGDPVTVKIGDNTRVVKDRQPIKFAEIKTDEVVFARGNLKDNVMEAGMVSVVNPQMDQMIGHAGRAGGGCCGSKREGAVNH